MWNSRHFLGLGLVLVWLWGMSPVRAASTVIERAKSATALVELPRRAGFGSAFCIDSTGLFVTNAHVVQELAKGKHPKLVLNAGRDDQKILLANVLQVDEADDLALMRVESPSPLPFLALGSLDDNAETTAVVALGFPFGKELALDKGEYPSVTVSLGHITSLRRSRGVLRQIQVDASVNPGNSGGPLINEQGQVVGIIYAGIEGAAGVNFAIPVTLLQKLLATPKTETAQTATPQAISPAEVPKVVFYPPLIAFDARTKVREWSIMVTPALGGPSQFTVTLILEKSNGTRRPFQARSKGQNKYVVRATPMTPSDTPAFETKTQVAFHIVVSRGGQTVTETDGFISLSPPTRDSTPKDNEGAE